MTRIYRRRLSPHSFEPLTMTWKEAAATAFRASESWLRDHLEDFPDFPRPDPALGLFATEAVQTWVRRRFGLVSEETTAEDAEAILLERARAIGAHPRQISRRSAV